MDIKFGNPSWRNFYEALGVDLRKDANDAGWVECECPFHPYKNHDKKYGAVNLRNGHYKCWAPDCQDAYRKQLGYSLDTQILTAREFLILHEHLSPQEAKFRVDDYIASLDEKEINTSTFDKVYRPKKEWTELAKEAEKNLSPDLLIVQEYMQSRNLKLETLKRFKVGYIPEDGDIPEYLLLPYYYKGAVVSARCRTIDGRKSTPRGSYQCLYNIEHALRSGSKTLIVVEGETDCLYLSQLLVENGIAIPVVGTPGALFKKEWSRDIAQFTKIICVPQDDDAAQGLVKQLKKVADKKLEVIVLPWEPLSTGKDIVDFCSQHNHDVIVSLIGNESSSMMRRSYSGTEFVKLAEVEVPYLIPHLIERGTKSLIIGEPKTYKTWIAMQLMDSVVNKRPFLGIENWTPKDDGLKAMLVEEEGSYHRMADRLQKVTLGENLDRFNIIHRQNIRMDDPKEFLALVEDVKKFQPDVLIFDPYVLLHSQDENSASGTSIVMSAFNKLLAIFPQMAIVIIHHATKGNNKSPRGSSALPGSVDEMLYVSRSDVGVITLELRGRDLVEGDNDKIALQFNKQTFRHEPLGIKIKSKEEQECEEAMASPLNDTLKKQIVRFLEKTELDLIPHQDMVKAFGNIASHVTIRKALDELVLEGKIKCLGETGRGKKKAYSLPTYLTEEPNV